MMFSTYNRSGRPLFALLTLSAALLAGEAGFGRENRLEIDESGPTVADAENSTEGIAQARQISEAFQKTSKAVIPSVVKIVVKSGGDAKSKKKFSFFGDFFSDFGGTEDEIEGVGSGVLVDPSGIVLTNNHVVSDSKNISVELYDGRQFGVTKVKKDSLSDLAVLTLDSKDPLPFLQFADSDSLEIGDWVLAIGNPFMLESSVSAGIISAKERSLKNKERGSFIQTDAAINPGNSGGPLVNLEGDVVGINTAIATLSGGYQGVGFAIPSNTARWIMRQLIEKGKVERAFLGVPAKTITYEESKKLGLSPREGVKAQTPYKDSPASKAGIRSNDIILAFDGKPIDSLETLQTMVECADVEPIHHLTILRKGEKNPLRLPIKLEIQPENYVGIPQTENLVDKGKHYNDRAVGLMVIPLTEDAAQRLDVGSESGVVILSALPGGTAYRAGLRDGMVITKIDGNRIASVDDYQKFRNAGRLETGIDVEVIVKKETKHFTLKNKR